MNLKQRVVFVIFSLTISQFSVAQRIVNELTGGWKFRKGATERASLPGFNDTGWLTTLKIQ